MTTQRAVFFDRDGVLNHTSVINGKPFAPKRFDDFVLVPDLKKQISRLSRLGFKIFVVTNQPDVGMGVTSVAEVEKMHSAIRTAINPDDIYACFHTREDRCKCRKPRPGMLYDAASKHGVNPSKSFLIGDRYSDIKAGISFGCKTILIDKNYNEEVTCQPWRKAANLSSAIDVVISNE